MRAEETRKLYTYNTFHAALAYWGALHGCETIADCFADAVVLDGAEGALRESCRALQAEYGWSDDEMARWADSVVSQTDSPALGDTVARYGADPRRKLGRSDRIAGPLLLARRHGVPAPYLTRVLAAALLYDHPDDAGAVAVQAQVTDLGPGGAARALCGFSEEEADLVNRVNETYTQLQSEAVWSKRVREVGALAFQYEQTYRGCGQCTFAALMDTLGEIDVPVCRRCFRSGNRLRRRDRAVR